MGNKSKRDVNQSATDLVAAITGLGAPVGVYDALIKRLEEKKAAVAAAAAGQAQKNPAAVALGRLGGLKGGKARAEALSAKERSEIAAKGAKRRWEVENMIKSGRTNRDVAKSLGISIEKVQELQRKISDRVKGRVTEAVIH
jgi:DNA-binding NarL/FixJ family response regulator